MSRWFRMYADALNNPKVQRLSGDDFKGWVNLLCLASAADGVLPGKDDIAFALRMDAKKAGAMVDRLVAARLLTVTETGFEPHDWNDLQYTSDVSTERVKRFRERSKQRRETVTETPPDTDTDTDTELPLANAKGAAPENSDKEFWDSAKAYLGNHGVKNPGALIGKWCRDHTKSAAAHAIARAQVERAVEPISFIEGVFKTGAPRDGPVVPL